MRIPIPLEKLFHPPARRGAERRIAQEGVQLMQRALSAHLGGGGVHSKCIEDVKVLRSVVTTYLTTGLAPALAAEGRPLNMRNEREMRTLAEAMDAILRGDLAGAGDILMQRFRSCEMNASEGSWQQARHLELIPEARVSYIPLGSDSN